MRVKEIKIYEFSELSAKVKVAVLDKERVHPDVFPWSDEWVNSLTSFCEHFNLTDLRYSVSAWNHSHCSAALSDEDLQSLKGVRLWKYLKNNGLVNDKFLSGDCPFTGYYGDESLLDPIREFMGKPSGITYPGLLDQCFASWIKGYVADEEYAYSDEALIESLDANEVEFFEDGRLCFE